MNEGITTVVLVDDHRAVRSEIRSLLQAHGGLRVLAESGDGHDALDLVERLVPDVLLLDVGLPGLNGLEVTERIGRQNLHTQVLMLSLHESPDYVSRAFRAGAAGYLVKDAVVAELGPALKTVLQGRRFISRAVDRKAVRRLLDAGTPDPPAESIDESARSPVDR